MGNRVLTLAIISVILCVCIIAPVHPVEANPIGIGESSTGGILSKNNNLTMPMAYVEICDTPSRVNETTFHHSITIKGNYTITSISDVETLLAFAYPSTWDLGWGSEVNSNGLSISINGTQVIYEIETAEEYLGEVTYDHYLYDWIKLGKLHFATFPLSVQSNETYVLEIDGYVNAIARVEDFIFSYCVGTGRTWAGHTQETIRFTVEGYSNFLDCSFYPNTSLTTTVVDGALVGEWNLNLSEFEANFVQATCTHFDRYAGDLQRNIVSVFVLVSIVILIVSVKKIRAK